MAPLPRLFAFVCCLGLLSSLFVLGGAGWRESPSAGPVLDIEDPTVELAEHPGMYVGGYGVIVETDPTVVEVEADDGTARLVRTENMPSAKKGDRVVFGGTITEDGSVEISRTRSVVRDPWETAYMYLISAIAALIVAILGIDLWHIDRRTLSLEPRETPLHETLRGSNNG